MRLVTLTPSPTSHGQPAVAPPTITESRDLLWMPVTLRHAATERGVDARQLSAPQTSFGEMSPRPSRARLRAPAPSTSAVADQREGREHRAARQPQPHVVPNVTCRPGVTTSARAAGEVLEQVGGVTTPTGRPALATSTAFVRPSAR